MKLLDNKHAVITGANRGIGLATMDTFAANGCHLWACVRNIEDSAFSDHISILSENHRVEITPVELDLTNNESVAAAAKAISRQKLPIDIIVNNAGVIDTSIFAMTSVKAMHEMFEVNFFAQMAFTQKLVRNMIKQKSGSIINMASSAAIEGNAGRLSYAASKSAMITASKVMSRELGPHGIRVNSVAPGLTDTDMMRDNHDNDIVENTLERVSLRRVAKPEEIANSLLFLGSDLASYVTGQVISVDGGM
ncbi:MAG: SDR family oxidoreductase [Pseudomonadales bacterium]|nr:SDR family oxidoreductase [Pseudomonadales bacterium]